MSELIVDATKNHLTIRALAICLGSAATLGVLVVAYRNQTRRKVGDLEADVELLRTEVDELKEQLLRGRTVTFTRDGSRAGHKSCLKTGDLRGSVRINYTSDDDYYTSADEDWIAPRRDATATNGVILSQPVAPAASAKRQAFVHCDKLFEELQGADEQYALMNKWKTDEGEDWEVLWRLARACQMQSGAFDKKDPRKKEKFFEGREYGQRACELSPGDFDAIKWAAVLTGGATDYLATKDRIEQGNVFKSYLDRALAIDPRDFMVLHMRGRFSYSVSQLTWVERKMASTFFADPPTATIQEAIEDFAAADKEKPEWPENLLWLGKSHIANKDKASARQVLEPCSRLTAPDEGGMACIREAKELLAKC
ncbi:unnamed protein product, partial [Mesorhabditis spiculigera]